MEEEKKRKRAAQMKAYRKANRKKEAAYQKAWREANREKHAAQHKAWREANREKHAALKKAWREANREKVVAYRKAYYEANRDNEAAKMKAWQQANPDKKNAMHAKRRSKKLQATPKWMTKADFAEIEEWYQIAKDLQWLSEEKLHVDHIIPLQGEDVCGLHIAANLQILPASMNLSKGNKTA